MRGNEEYRITLSHVPPRLEQFKDIAFLSLSTIAARPGQVIIITKLLTPSG
jgi:hypothetical protein